MSIQFASVTMCALYFGAIPAFAEEFTLADVAFLEGAWRGGDAFVFEETWSAPGGGVMTGMARGYEGDALRVLEYIVIAQSDDAVVMRFKHFNADYTTWDGEEKNPIHLTLTKAADNDVTFTADPPSHDVKSIRYWSPTADTLQADIVLFENNEEGGFTLKFERTSP